MPASTPSPDSPVISVSAASIVVADWGTSSFRLWALGADSAIVAHTQKDCGMGQLQPADFENTLEAALQEMGAGPQLPVVICGMAGSAQGWVEAPYVDLPASTAALAAQAVRVKTAQRPVYIIPGICQSPEIAADVIRGEETLLLGLSLLETIDGLVCLPGTHSKWARVRGQVIEAFHTAMTGEVYALLSSSSTWSHFMNHPITDLSENAAFRSAVAEALAAPEKILQALFSVRAIPLLATDAAERDMPARLSGLLIGLEIAGQNPPRSSQVTLVANGHLADAYQSAFDVAGIDYHTFDAEALACAGLFEMARQIMPDVFSKPESEQI